MSTETVTVRVWQGERYDKYDELLEEEPDEYEIEPLDADVGYVQHRQHTVLAEDIDHHGTYAFHVDTDRRVELIVETNDSYHAPKEGFNDGRPIEGGLLFAPEGDSRYEEAPFQCELWGRIRMRVEEADPE